ncbi:NHL domain-containing protein [Actinidia rufa]|uniref:NHL domain-containing protein n=1 Tax=Actinidia rufa TaxID=165716 RepID=A0A7J0EXA4_9ERIC|nr:NHL domain-containing protein [Actinidia rufa]
MTPMGKNALVLALTIVVLFGGFSSAQATSPASEFRPFVFVGVCFRFFFQFDLFNFCASMCICEIDESSFSAEIVNGFLSNAVSVLMKWLWSLKATTKTAITGRPMMKFESGYTVETVFDGSKLGIEPYSVEVLPSGELMVLDSSNSNLYKISSPLSQYSRPKLVAGSSDGYSGHIDGKLRDARMNNPKGLAVDDRGNIYIADTMNMAIRKIGDAGVTTIAGGKWGRGGGHVDGPSEDAKFSNDFDVVYIGSSCSLLVIDRGSQAIREIQLHFDDCAYQYGSGFPLGIAVLVAAGFFGIICWRCCNEELVPSCLPQMTREQQNRVFLQFNIRRSLGKLLANAGASFTEIFGGIFLGFRKKAPSYQYQQPQQKYSNTWPVQESFVIPDEDEPPSIETRTPTPRKTYPFMSKDADKMQQLRQSRAFYSGWDRDLPQQPTQKQQHHHQYRTSAPQTYYEQSCEKTNEVVFGAVQEQDGQREAVVIKPLDHWNSVCNDRNIRSRINSMGNTYAH